MSDMSGKSGKIPAAQRRRLKGDVPSPESTAARGVSARERARLVGYGSPPVHTRWKPGRSGNPSGRPKGSKSLASLVRQIARRKITSPSDGRCYSLHELIVVRLFNEAARGNISAIRLAMACISYAEETISAVAPGRLPARERDLQAIRQLLLTHLFESDKPKDDE